MGDFHHLAHVKEQAASRRTLWIVLGLTLFFTIVEVTGGIVSKSLALLSDSAHMISDVGALGLSLLAVQLASRRPNSRYTYGYLRFETIAALLNGLALCAISVGIFIEGARRFVTRPEIDYGIMLTIAVIGLVVNIVLTAVLSRSVKEENNLNIKSALWHFIGDMLSSIGVIVSAVLIYFTGWHLFDPIISIIIGGIIFGGGVKIIRQSFRVLMESVPEGFELEEIRRDIAKVEGVLDVHEMHFWAISTDHNILTAHVFIKADIQPFCVILAINEMLKDKYKIMHATIQTEHAQIHPHGEYGRQFLEDSRPREREVAGTSQT